MRYAPLHKETEDEIIRLHALGYGSSSIPLKMKGWRHGTPSGSRVYLLLKTKGLIRNQTTARTLGCRLRGKEPKAKRGE